MAKKKPVGATRAGATRAGATRAGKGSKARPSRRTGSGRVHSSEEEKAEVKQKFIDGLIDNYGCVIDGLRRAGISRKKYDRLRAEDPEFANMVSEIREGFIDKLERSCMKRAIEGHKKTVTAMGEVVGEDTVYETGLSIFMLKCNRPGQYGDKIEVNIGPEELAKQMQSLIAGEDQAAANALEGDSDA